MKQSVADIGEFGLIERIQSLLGEAHGSVAVGLGDDAATFVPTGKPIVVSTDAMVEDVHFRLDWTSAEHLAHKSLASTLSDLAAKAAKPLHTVISLGTPGQLRVEWIERFYRSLADKSKRWNTQIIGGDTVSSEKLWMSLTTWGEQSTAQPIRIDNAKPGDKILVTGTLGGAAGGLKLLKDGNTDDPNSALIERFSCPVPRLEESMKLVKTVIPSTMTDISDGISRDLRKICSASGMGAEVCVDHLPICPALLEVFEKQAVEMAWQGGEDYELLLTLAPKETEELMNGWDQSFCRLTAIGEITTKDHGIVLHGLDEKDVAGFDHFKK